MPIQPASAYTSLETVLNLIRAIANDMIYSQAGEIFLDNATFMLPLVNDAGEWFTFEMNNHGVDAFTKETVLTPLTAVPAPNSVDPATQVNMSDTGYFDSVGMHIGPQLQLPPDLINPIFLWERQTGSTENWVEMRERPDGLPSIQPSSRFRVWEYRQESLYMLGATQSNDIRLRYKGRMVSFISPQDFVYFRGAGGAMAYKVVATYLASKNPAASQAAESMALERVSQIATSNARMKQREGITRQSYGNQGRRTNFIPPRNP